MLRSHLIWFKPLKYMLETKVFFPFREYNDYSPPTFRLTMKLTTSISTLMFTWRTTIHIKDILAPAPTGCHVFCALIITLQQHSTEERWQSCLVLYRTKVLPPVEVPYHLYVIYLFFLSPSVTFRLLFSLSPCVVGVMFLFPLSEVVSGVQRWGVLSEVRVSLLTADESKNTQIKTSVNCVKGRQTMVFIRGSSR